MDRNARIKAAYEAAAIAGGWKYSAAHGGFVHADERRGPSEADYVVLDAKDACWLHDIQVKEEL